MAAFWRFLISLAYGSLATLAHLARIGRILPGCHISLQRLPHRRTVLITIAYRSGLLIIRAGLITIAYLIRDGDVSGRIDKDLLSIKNADVSGRIDKLSLWYKRTTVQTYYSTGVLQAQLMLQISSAYVTKCYEM